MFEPLEADPQSFKTLKLSKIVIKVSLVFMHSIIHCIENETPCTSTIAAKQYNRLDILYSIATVS